MEYPEQSLKSRYIHRDLSWLAFNERVLEEAGDESNPLLEQARFLAICAGNMDEFFMVRVAGLLRLVDAGYNRQDAFGWYPAELYAAIRDAAARLNDKLYAAYTGRILKKLAGEFIFVRRAEELSPEQKKFAARFFETNVFPVVTPMAIDQGHPFPVLPSRTMAFAVRLSRYDKPYLAVIPIPKSLERLVRLPSAAQEQHFMLLEEIIRTHIDAFFRGYKVAEHAVFRVIRDSELSFEEEFADDLLKAMEEEVKKRPKARVVSMEVQQGISADLLGALCELTAFPEDNAALIGSDMDLSFLFSLHAQTSRDDLKYPARTAPAIAYDNIFERIKEGDFLQHVPFQSFDATVDLLKEAAQDEHVIGIKMTLYRTSESSAIVQALEEAAKRKKQVTVLVELKARFDEEKNITWARGLEEAGCHVVYGIPGVKIHSKMALIVRKEDDRIRRYVHLSTGNYNEKTAAVYTDIGYFTANDDFARDISDVFNVITGYSMPSRWKRIISSPYDLREYFIELIGNEIESQKKNRNGLIIAKLNSLEDPQLIEKLYEASREGVRIRLIVRGICCLIPGVPRLSEHIQVRSVVGRFLEHSRIYFFNNNGDPQVFLASNDMMRRNFDHRIELLFGIHKEQLKEELRQVLDVYWKDSWKTRLLGPDGVYSRPAERDPQTSAQDFFLKSHFKT